MKNLWVDQWTVNQWTGFFMISGFQEPMRLDITSKRGRMLVYIKSSLPSRIMINIKRKYPSYTIWIKSKEREVVVCQYL